MAWKTLFFQDRNVENWLDERLFNELFEHYWEKLFGFCSHHTQDVECSREIVQEIFLSLWERRAEVDIQVNIGHYLFSAARFRIARHFKNQSYKSRQLALLTETTVFETNNTQDAVHFEDLHKYISELVEKLPFRCRQVYTLSRNEGMTLPEIAASLNISQKTAEAHLTKALKSLRTQIDAVEV